LGRLEDNPAKLAAGRALCGSRLGREKFRQLVGTQTDTEYWPTWLKGNAGIE
jgi:hypothetical protein